MDFEAIEVAVRREALRLAARAVEQRLNADHTDHSGAMRPCVRCEQQARYVGRRRKKVVTALAPMTLERAYYHCASCDHGFFPRDAALGVEGTSLSPAVTRMVGITAAMNSFNESSELLREIGGIDVDTKQVERTAEALGAEIAADEHAFVEPIDSGPVAPTLYLGVDGTGVPMRKSELVGRTDRKSVV